MLTPLRIHKQSKSDECTSCALAAIAEDVLGLPVDPSFIYRNSKDSEFGIEPTVALNAVVNEGVQIQDLIDVMKPYTSYKRVWGWCNPFEQYKKALQNGRGSLFCGCYWQYNWDSKAGGVMALPEKWEKYGAHAFKVFGFDDDYLYIQDSRGESSGNKGIWKAPKEVVNKFSFAYQLI